MESGAFGHLVYVFVRKDNDAKLPSDGLQLNASKLESDLDSMIFWHISCRQHIYICSNCLSSEHMNKATVLLLIHNRNEIMFAIMHILVETTLMARIDCKRLSSVTE